MEKGKAEAVLCGQARGHESSGAHGKRVKPPHLGCSRQVLALIKGEDACQAKKAQAWTDWYGRSIASTPTPRRVPVTAFLSQKDRNKKRGWERGPPPPK
jgi:hypothetical protein